MTTSTIAHTSADGRVLEAVLSLAALKSLDRAQIAALDGIGIRRLSDLLHFKPIHDARLLVAATERRLAHDLDLSDLLDPSARATPVADLAGLDVRDLASVGPQIADALRDAFGVRTVRELAALPAFREAQRFLLPADGAFNEPASAPDELLPRAIGHVESTATYSTFVQEATLRLRGLELVYDADREHLVDPRLAGLFPVRGIGPIFSRGGNGAARSRAFLRPAPAPVPELHLAYVAKTTQRWVNMGTHLGEIVHSLALAPGESRNIAVVDWKRRQVGQRSEDTQVTEHLTNELFHARALDEVTRSVAREHQSGGTSIDAATLTTSAATVAGAALVGAGAGALVGLSVDALTGGATMGLGTLTGAVVGAGAGAIGSAAVISGNGQLGVLRSDSSGTRAILGSVQQDIAEMTSQKASSVRSLWSTIVVSDEQAEREHLSTRNVTNYNHSHALTIQYYEVLQHYRSVLALTDAEPLLLLPFRPLEFTFDLIADHWQTLRRGIRDRLLRERFDRLVALAEAAEEEAEEATHLRRVSVRIGGPGATVPPVVGIGVPTVELLGADARRATVGGMVVFDLDDERPLVADFDGVRLTGFLPSAPVRVELYAEVGGEDGPTTYRYARADDLRIDDDGSATFRTTLRSGPADDELQDSLLTLERYFNERRYRFTRLLLLAIEPEQLVDLVEALMLRAAVNVPPIGGGGRPGAIGPFVPRERDAGRATAEIARSRVAALVADRLGAARPSERAAAARRTGGPSARAMAEAVAGAVAETVATTPGDAVAVRAAAARTARATLAELGGLGAPDRGAIAEAIAGLVDEAVVAVGATPDVGAAAVHLADLVDPSPAAIVGNTLVFKLKRVADQDVLDNPLAKKHLRRVLDFPADLAGFVRSWPDPALGQRARHDDVYLPTSGVFAEAILGRSNASEKVDLTRFFNWQDSPIPHLAPQIAPLVAGSRAQEDLDTAPNVPGSVLNIVNPAAFPDPTGLAASLAAVQNGAIFRDMSKAEVLGSVLSNLASLASQQGQLAGTLAGDARQQALQSATDLANKVAALTAQLAQTPTDKAGALNELTRLEQAPNPPPLDGTAPTPVPEQRSKEAEKERVIGVPAPPPRTLAADDLKNYSFLFQFQDIAGTPMGGEFTVQIVKDGRVVDVPTTALNDPSLIDVGHFLETVSLRDNQEIGIVSVTGKPSAAGALVDFTFRGSGRFKLPRTTSSLVVEVRLAAEETKVTASRASEVSQKIVESTQVSGSGNVGGGADFGLEIGNDVVKVKPLIKVSGGATVGGQQTSGEETTTGTSTSTVREFTARVPTGRLNVTVTSE